MGFCGLAIDGEAATYHFASVTCYVIKELISISFHYNSNNHSVFIYIRYISDDLYNEFSD
jgi:hypothetical protein